MSVLLGMCVFLRRARRISTVSAGAQRSTGPEAGLRVFSFRQLQLHLQTTQHEVVETFE
jgi:hypothetical protein